METQTGQQNIKGGSGLQRERNSNKKVRHQRLEKTFSGNSQLTE